MKHTLILILAVSCGALAQEGGNVMIQSTGPAGAIAWGGTFERGTTAPVKGAPYSATMNNESIQTLADGNRIVQSNTGTVARDSQGRTRQDAALPAIGNLSAASTPHLVFIQDPVAGTSYTLNLTDKTAWKNPTRPAEMDNPGTVGTNQVFITAGGPPPGPLPPPPAIAFAKRLRDDPADVTTESLGSQTVEGVIANGVRTTRVIPAGQIGNERPISVVTEVWTSTDLKTIVSSKRNDPRMGEQTFRLTNIARGEPDPSLFSVPADFKTIDGGPKTFIYRRNQ